MPLPKPAEFSGSIYLDQRDGCMALNRIWSLRADSTWTELVSVQACEAGRSHPSAYVRDLVWTLAQNPTVKSKVFEVLQGVQYGKSAG
jgi:hypothetical protein